MMETALYQVTTICACSIYDAVLIFTDGHTTAELTFRWNEANSQPVEINNNIELPEHIIGQPDIKNCTKTYNTTGKLTYQIHLKSYVYKKIRNFKSLQIFTAIVRVQTSVTQTNSSDCTKT